MSATSAQIPDDSTVATLSNTTCTSSTLLTDGGYDYELLGSDTDSRYECPICLLYLRDPVLTTCGHRFCERCISKWVIKEGGKCPVDGVPLEYENIFPDNFTRREILQCRAKCPYGKEGCSVVLSLSELEKHIHSIHTPSSSTTNSSTGTGKGNNGGGSSNSLVECYYKEVGCLNFFPQENLQRHLELDMHHHLQLLTAAYRRLKLSRPQDHFLRQDSRDSTRWLLADEAMDSDNYQFRRQRSWDSVRFARQAHSRPRFEDRLAESEESLCKSNSKGDDLQEKGQSSCTKSRAESLNGSYSHTKELFDRVVRLEQSDREKQIKIDRLESQLSSAVNLFSTVTRAMDDITALYCNGLYIWKVNDLTRKCIKMRKNPLEYQSSPCFGTGVYGYKLSLRFGLSTNRSRSCAEGAVGGRLEFPPLDKDTETGVSLNIHFMRGEYDQMLSWPFTGAVTLEIVHPDPKESLSDILHARPQASAFCRPTEAINKTGFGYSNFYPINKIFTQGFVNDDTLIFKICVTPNGTIQKINDRDN